MADLNSSFDSAKSQINYIKAYKDISASAKDLKKLGKPNQTANLTRRNKRNFHITVKQPLLATKEEPCTRATETPEKKIEQRTDQTRQEKRGKLNLSIFLNLRKQEEVTT